MKEKQQLTQQSSSFRPPPTHVSSRTWCMVFVKSAHTCISASSLKLAAGTMSAPAGTGAKPPLSYSKDVLLTKQLKNASLIFVICFEVKTQEPPVLSCQTNYFCIELSMSRVAVGNFICWKETKLPHGCLASEFRCPWMGA